MSSQNFAGAVDLGALASQKDEQRKADAALANAPDGLILDVSAATFQTSVIDRSMSVPVVLDLWATWCGPCKQLSPVLERLAVEYGGKWILAKVDVDAEQQIAAAFQVQSIPSVFALIKGQPIPLFQGALPEQHIRQYLDKMLEVAQNEGVTGVAVDTDSVPQEGELATIGDPRMEAAADAIEAGDWAAARASYTEILDDVPGDADAQAGLALVNLLERTEGLDTHTDLPAGDVSDVPAQLASADAEAARGDWAASFSRLIATVAANSGEEREQAKSRLLELFLIAGEDPAVPAARSALANALF